MNLKAAFIILSVAAFAAITPAWGQGAGGSTNPAMLLRRDDVRADLQITDDQKSKLYDLEQGLRDRFSEAMRTAGQDPETRRKAFENQPDFDFGSTHSSARDRHSGKRVFCRLPARCPKRSRPNRNSKVENRRFDDEDAEGGSRCLAEGAVWGDPNGRYAGNPEEEPENLE